MNFISKLTQQFSSPASLLNQLSSMHGLAFLSDLDQPTIVFNPKQYLLVSSQHYSYYEKTKLGYQKVPCDNIYEFIGFEDLIVKRDLNKTGFQGGYVGFISYDYAAKQLINIEPRQQPIFYMGKYESFLKHHSDGWYFYSTSKDAALELVEIEKLLSMPCLAEPLRLVTPFVARWSKAEYSRAFKRVQDYILAGDCYQINLTQEFSTISQGSLLSRSEQLWDLTAAPYSAYLKIHAFELLSCSPELFIEFNQRKLITRPIKGTMPRFDEPLLDQKSKQTLKNSSKDQAENLMIVDLLRNDLSKYAQVGSVKANKLFEIESFNQVHHMLSEIEATLKPEINPFDVLMSALPGGSITGAPKIRAMQIINELEGASRGAYCGSMGYFNFDGSGRWNILIRSVQKFEQQLSVWAGGGITVASDCDAEYQECFDKVSAMLDLLNTWQEYDR